MTPQNIIRTAATATVQAHYRQPQPTYQSHEPSEHAPLLALHEPSRHIRKRSRLRSIRTDGWLGTILNNSFRSQLKRFLLSKYAHYMVLMLVALDVAGIFADFLISLHICEHTCGEKVADDAKDIQFWKDTSKGLGIVSLVFSSAFMLELAFSIYAFGRSFFKSAFHLIDALSITASFVVDVVERGTAAEAGSLIIALRLFRVFKIIEEGSSAAEEIGSDLEERLKMLEDENAGLRQRLLTTSSA